MWNKGNPTEDDRYLVAVNSQREKAWVETIWFFCGKWLMPQDWKILGWQELPRWEEKNEV